MLMSGPLTATGAQGASRFEAVGKSPMSMPEGFCYGNLGGFFGPYLKRAGYDGIVVIGCAERPCYIWINDGKAEILDASVANMRFVKPLDDELVARLAGSHQLLVTLEENVTSGGAGSAVQESLAAQGLNTPVLQLGLPDRFVEHGTREALLAECGLDSGAIIRAVENRLRDADCTSRPVRVK